MPDPFRPPENFVGVCAECGKEDLKRNMKTLYVKEYGTIRVFCHLCDECFQEWVNGLKVKPVDTRGK